MDYKNKYLKYKSKYLELKKQIGAKKTREENRILTLENRAKEKKFLEEYRRSNPEKKSSFLDSLNIFKKDDINPTEILKEKDEDEDEKKDAEQDDIDNEKDVNKMLTRIKDITKLPIIDGKLEYNSNRYNNDYGIPDNKKLTEVTIPQSITYIENNAFTHNLLTSINIPSSITWIGKLAFAFNKLESVNIPDSVKHIHEYAFANNNLKSVTIPKSVTYIGEYAFANNNNLTSVTILNSVRHIGYRVFDKSPISKITIPANFPIEKYAYLFTDSILPTNIIRL